MAQEQKNVQEQDLNQLRKVRREKLAELQGSGKDPFVITKYDQTHHSVEVKENYEELEGKQVSIAGRMMSKRVMGKASFCNVQDLKGNIQSYVARDSIGEENYKEFKKLDVGDVIGIEGEVFKTKTGEISIHASHVTLLSKSLQILPEKFHGLTNTDMRAFCKHCSSLFFKCGKLIIKLIIFLIAHQLFAFLIICSRRRIKLLYQLLHTLQIGHNKPAFSYHYCN